MAEGSTRRVEAPAVRRAQIIDAAKQRFREAGFQATTMADIAASAGVSVGLLYRYFPGKEDIIRAIVEADLEAQLFAVERGLDDHPDDPAAALEAVMSGVSELVLDRDRTLLMLEIAAETARSAALATLAMEIERRVSARLTARFGANMPDGESETRVRMMLNMFSALGLEAYRHPENQAVAKALTAQAVRQLLHTGQGLSDV